MGGGGAGAGDDTRCLYHFLFCLVLSALRSLWTPIDLSCCKLLSSFFADYFPLHVDEARAPAKQMTGGAPRLLIYI